MLRKIFVGLVALVVLAAIGLTAGFFALKRPDIPFETLEAAYADGRSQYLDMGDGVRVHFREEGPEDGRILLMIHGFSASLETWEPWVGELKDRYRIVRLDLPGHGLTRAPEGYAPTMEGYADLVERFAARRGLGPVVVIGSSMGGNVAWQLALRHPARVGALVLVGASGWPDERLEGGPPVAVRILRDPVIGPLMMQIEASQFIRDGLLQAYADDSFVTDALVTRVAEMARGPGRREMLRTLSTDLGERTPANPERMAQIIAPTLVLHGDQDLLVPVAGGRRFAETIRGAKLIEYAGVGHLPHEEIASRSAGDLVAFLEGLPVFSPLGQPLAITPPPPPEAAPALRPPGVSPPPPPPPLEGVY